MFYILIMESFLWVLKKNISCRCFKKQHEKQITDYCIFLMMPNEVGWHYITVKKWSAFLRRVTWKQLWVLFSEFSSFVLNKKGLKSEVEIIAIIQVNIELHLITSNLRYSIPKYSIPKEIPIVFHTRINYDYHFIIIELVKECKGAFSSPG